MRSELTGTGVALVTPFREDGNPDYDALRKLVRFVTDGGVEYLVVLGTTGESATLSDAEKDRILETVAEENAGRLPLVAGIGGNDTHGVLRRFEQTRLDGYDAILSVSPYYNRPTQEGIYRHFELLARHTPLPMIVYNVPTRTGSNVLPETVARLARDCDRIVGIKEACGDMDQVRQLLAAVPEDFLVISGDDFTAVPTALAGGAGVISVLGQALPEAFSGMMRRALSGEAEEAMARAASLETLTQLIFREGNPAGIKALLTIEGICGPEVRLPLVPATASLRGDLERCLEALGETEA